MALQKPREYLRPLCCQHHVLMKPVQLERSNNPFTTYSLAYACPRSGCFICYASSTGYFTIEESDQNKRAEVPQVSCPQDGQPMYLAEVHPQKTSLRLWKCGNTKCQGSRTIEEFVFEPDDPFVEQYFRMNP
jgi:hypothetical protein